MPARPFRPAWWLPGRHAQTIGAMLLRPAGGVAVERERVELPGGDFLDLDWTVAAAGLPPGRCKSMAA